MSHSSQADPIPHSTIRVRNAQNYDVAVGHVADDASQQLVCVIVVLLVEARISQLISYSPLVILVDRELHQLHQTDF